MHGRAAATTAGRIIGVGRSDMITAALLLPAAVALMGLVDATVAGEARHAPSGLVALGRFVTEFGTSAYMFAYSAITAAAAGMALRRGHVRWRGMSLRPLMERSVFFFLAIAASGIAAQVIKHVLGRARPVLASSEGAFSFHPLSLPNDLTSFPSGHTTSAFAAAVALGLLFPGRRWWLVGCAALVGVSRVVVGAHYPSDVLGGVALGSLAALWVAWACASRGLAFDARAGQIVPKD